MASSSAAPFPLVHDAQEADAQGEQGQAEPDRAQHRLARVMGAPCRVTTWIPKTAMPSVLPLTAHW